MANEEQVALLKQGVETWNAWRGDNPDIIHPDLRTANLSGALLSEADLSGAFLSGAHLNEANLSGANLSGADLSGANFSGADLSGANFSGAKLIGANLNDANLNNANLIGADFWKANLVGANLNGANFSGVRFCDANLVVANLSWADLNGADLSGANLVRADLRNANLGNANLMWANLRGATLAGVKNGSANRVTLFYPSGVEIRGANFTEANLAGGDLSEADLIGASLIGANLGNANLRRANLSEADLRGANLIWAELREANLRGAKLRGANLSWADLREADLVGADLSEASLVGANLRGTTLEVLEYHPGQLFDAGSDALALPEPMSADDEPAFPPEPARSLSPTAPAGASPVDAAVFCPPSIPKGSRLFVQVWLYPPGDEDAAMAHARETDPEAGRRGTYSFPLDVPPNTRVDLHLEMPGLEVEEPDAVLIWRNRLTTAQFEVGVPATVPGTAVIGRVRFAVNGIPAGTLRFKVGLSAVGANAGPVSAREAEAERYHRAFVSYSSQDRAEVLKRVMAFRIAGLSVFQDILDLEPGERWARELYREIDNCDVFLLFWSKAAAASEWVAREIAYALERKAGSDDKPPAIQPVPIEGPPPPSPPDALRHLHFNDALLAHIQAAAASAQPAGREGA